MVERSLSKKDLSLHLHAEGELEYLSFVQRKSYLWDAFTTKMMIVVIMIKGNKEKSIVIKVVMHLSEQMYESLGELRSLGGVQAHGLKWQEALKLLGYWVMHYTLETFCHITQPQA